MALPETDFLRLPDTAEKQFEHLSKYDQSALIKFVDASDERDYLHRIQVAEHQHIEHQTSENTRRWCMAGLWSLAIAVFMYAGLTKDSTLPRDIAAIAIPTVGGVKLFEKRNKS
jgi:hypothetical protein